MAVKMASMVCLPCLLILFLDPRHLIEAVECPNKISSRCFLVLEKTTGAFSSVQEARDMCLEEGYDIASILSAQENNFARNLISDSIPLSNNISRVDMVYIGLSDINAGSTYAWIDTEPQTYTNIPVQLPSYYNDERNCFAAHSLNAEWLEGEDIEWMNVPCCFPHHMSHVLCSKSVNGSPLNGSRILMDHCSGECGPGAYLYLGHCYWFIKNDLGPLTYTNVTLHCMTLKAKVLPYERNLESFIHFALMSLAGRENLEIAKVYLEMTEEVSVCKTLVLQEFHADQVVGDCCAESPVDFIACSKPLGSDIVADIDADQVADLCYGNINECLSSPCNNGTCINKILSYECECNGTDYEGSHCEILWYECFCTNGGTCNEVHDVAVDPHIHNYTCSCGTYYSGRNCEIEIDPVDECLSNPCVTGLCVNLREMYRCDCEPGKFGINCENDIECPALTVLNANLSSTTGINYRHKHTFHCLPGYLFADLTSIVVAHCGLNATWNSTLLDDGCIEDVDECESSPCKNEGLCTNNINSYNCSCAIPYGGVNCEIAITPCLPNPCNNNGHCDVLNQAPFSSTSYVCDCPQGYNGTNCEILWNHCMQPMCQNGGTCIVTTDATTSPPSHYYNCVCGLLFTGQNCETVYDPVDECASNPCVSGTCVNLVDMYRCDCDPAQYGTLCEIDVQCQALSVINSNETFSHGRGYMERRAYNCYTDFLFSDLTANKIVFCQQDSTWNDTAVLSGCRESCRFLPVVHNSSLDQASGLVNVTITYTCNIGHEIDSNLTAMSFTCTANRVWEPSTTLLSCSPRECPVLPIHPNQHMQQLGNTYDTTITFWCEQGYKLFDNSTVRTIRCLVDGQWSSDLPPCQPKKCPEVSLKARQTRNTSDTQYETFAMYTCDDGMRMLDGSSYKIIYCNAEQAWSQNITDCTPNRCFPLPYVANATPSTTNADYWTKSTLTCFSGHKFMRADGGFSKDVMLCQENGWWSPILTSCEPIYCAPISMVGKNLIRNSELRLFGTKVTYSCYQGFYTNIPQMEDSFDNECLETQEWSKPYIPECHPIECPAPPPTPINGHRSTLTTSRHFYSAIVSYVCNDGKKFINGQRAKNLFCNELGRWNDTDVSCRSARCESVNILPNSTPDRLNTDWYVVVKYHCKLGHFRSDGLPYFAIKCLVGGIWNESFDHSKDCKVKMCPAVKQFSNSTVNNTMDNVFDTILAYSCHPGFKYQDAQMVKYRRCNQNAVWMPTIFPPCQINHCEPLPAVENTTRDSNNTHYSTEIIFDCMPGYQLPDKTNQQITRCTENATWTHNPQPCEVVFCPPLPHWSRSVFNTTDNNFLSNVQYHCKNGSAFKFSLDLPGNLTILTSTCSPSKKWDPPLETCYALAAINADIAGKSYESPDAYSLGSVSCAVVAVVIGVVFFIDLSKIMKDLRLMRRNINRLLQSRKNNRVQASG